MKSVVEGNPYPVFIEAVELPVPVGNRIGLRIGNHGQGESQITQITLTQARLLAYALLREVEERQAKTERLNEEARSENQER